MILGDPGAKGAPYDVDPPPSLRSPGMTEEVSNGLFDQFILSTYPNRCGWMIGSSPTRRDVPYPAAFETTNLRTPSKKSHIELRFHHGIRSGRLIP